jgi:hypothetical protein
MLTEEEIRLKLGDIKCLQGQCTEVEKKIRQQLFDKEAQLNNTPYNEVNAALENIKEALSNKDAFVIAWISTGFDEHGSAVNHFLIINSYNPLQSFSVWQNGIDFYSEEETRNHISNTINSEAHGKKIDIHIYQKSEAQECATQNYPSPDSESQPVNFIETSAQ